MGRGSPASGRKNLLLLLRGEAMRSIVGGRPRQRLWAPRPIPRFAGTAP